MSKIWISFIFIICQINVIELVFVKAGYYINLASIGINDGNCGLRLVPQTLTPIGYGPKCFGNEYHNWTFADYSLPIRLAKSASRIFDGQATTNNEAPWTVYLGFRTLPDEKETHFCTGSLITSHWILSAAYCFDNRNDFNRVVAITISRKLPEQEGRTSTILWKKMFAHPKYKDDKNHDLALFKLAEPFYPTVDSLGLTYTVNTICLPDKGQHNQKEETATFYGFGKPWAKRVSSDTRIHRGDVSLKKAEFTLKPNQQSNVWEVTNNNKSGPSTCVGDSGGPLVQYVNNGLRAVLVGSAMGIPRYAECPQDKSYFLTISENIDWIFKTIRDDIETIEEEFDDFEAYPIYPARG